ncbi:MAG: glycine cleavage system aminomethyltransferase GcvT, partial [Alphaproteobacteria bacterium]
MNTIAPTIRNDQGWKTLVAENDAETLKETPLTALHRECGARLVPFAGYLMPVHFETGILAEHAQCRQRAALFDVSHMGQIRISGTRATEALETLVPGDIAGLREGSIRYTVFTNARGGIEDDLMVTRAPDHLLLVVNASRKAADLAHLTAAIGRDCDLLALSDRALLALQGPAVAATLARLAPGVETMTFMTARALSVDGIPCFVSRSGYTGEDGFELSVLAGDAEALARRLLALPGVAPVGLGARDSLRLEAGLCLHGSDITDATTPVEADLSWVVPRRRRETGGFPGAEIVRAQLTGGTERVRIGLAIEGRVPARSHAVITD